MVNAFIIGGMHPSATAKSFVITLAADHKFPVLVLVTLTHKAASPIQDGTVDLRQLDRINPTSSSLGLSSAVIQARFIWLSI